MNKYIIKSSESSKSKALVEKLKTILTSDWVEDEKDHEYIFVIGGDGTFIHHFDSYDYKKVIPINGGNLGYYSFFNEKNISGILKRVCDDDQYIVPDLIHLEIDNKKVAHAINEFYIRSDVALETDIYINDAYYQHFKGSGLMLSTTFGSTAHCKSANGAVVFPTIETMQLLEIEPITQKEYLTLQAPLVLPVDCKIDLKNISRPEKHTIIIDGRPLNLKQNAKEIFLKSCHSRFKLYNPNTNKNYIDKLRKSFIRE